MRALLLSLIVLTTLFSCDSKQNKTITLKESTGRINHLTIVIDNDLWRGEVGDSLRQIIANPVLGLPQEEAQFSITQVPTKSFGKLFKSTRNLLFVGISEKEGYWVNNDMFASPQLGMNIIAKDKESLLSLINEHKNDIIDVFKGADLKLYQAKVTKDHWESKEVKTLSNFNVSMDIPKKYDLIDDTNDFLWFRYDIDKGSMNIIGYSLPFMYSDSIVNNIVAARDTIGKKYIPGPSKDSYMITEAAYTPFIKKVDFNGLTAFETRGKWEVYNDFMAGPFLSYTILDEKNNRVLVFEGFTFAPSINKRDYMFELEAIIKTLKI
ncbi:MAG: DUF4837 family protein [Flavobacteriaceae bacterium]